MSTATSVLVQLATIEKEILDPVSSKALYAYDNIPYTLAAAQMPCFVNFPGNLISNVLDGSDEFERYFIETRNYLLNLYLFPYGTGTNQEKSGLLTPYLELVYETFGKYPHLKAHPGILDAQLVNDTGTSILNYVVNQYFGIQFTLRVSSRVKRLLASTD